VLALLVAAAPRLARENLFGEGGRVPEDAPLRALPPLPERAADPRAWIDTEPLSTDDLRGRVWVMKAWTFGCVNCVRSIPFTNALVERHGDALGVLGIHAPEFDRERDPAALAASVREHGVRFPSYVDDDLAYFLALDAPGWPTFYVVDRDLRIRGRWAGEVHEGTLRARELEALVDELLAE
jgi:thiol-disulfide isomerase/thioredoxin